MDSYLLATITDIHGNKEALDAILKDIALAEENIRNRGYNTPIRIICLGDTVGYGPDQLECLAIAKDFDIHLEGNHERMLRERMKDRSFKPETINKTAIKSHDLVLDQMFGKQKITSEGITINIPEETLDDMLNQHYTFKLAQEIIRKNIKKANASPNRVGFFQRTIPDETQEQIAAKYLTQFLTLYPELFQEYRHRIKRRNTTIGIYKFLNKLKKQRIFRLENAAFVHDNPVKPGDEKYLVGPIKQKQINKEYTVPLHKINNIRFHGIEYIFVGHSHALAEIEEINKKKLVYCGGGVPAGDNPDNKASYNFSAVQNNRVVHIYPPRILECDWRKTDRKTQKLGMKSIFRKK